MMMCPVQVLCPVRRFHDTSNYSNGADMMIRLIPKLAAKDFAARTSDRLCFSLHHGLIWHSYLTNLDELMLNNLGVV